MGVAAALAPASTKAPPERTAATARPRVLQVRPTSHLLQRACECGVTAGLSGRCTSCDRVSLGPGRDSDHAPAMTPAASNVVTALSAASQATGGRTGLGHDFRRVDVHAAGTAASIQSSAAGSRAGASITPLRRVQVAAPIGPQAQLHISSPNDPAEQEARTIGKLIARMPEPAPTASRIGPAISNTPADQHTVYRKETGTPTATPDVMADLKAATSGGAALPHDMLSFMERRFGADFTGVRVHTDERAAHLCSRLTARAFTIGHDIYFGKDQFRTDTPEGWELIAHELTHTIQQGSVRQLPATPPQIHEPQPAARTPAASPASAKTAAPAPAKPVAPAPAPVPAKIATPIPAKPVAPASAPMPAKIAEPVPAPVKAVAQSHVPGPAQIEPQHPTAPASVAPPLHVLPAHGGAPTPAAATARAGESVHSTVAAAAVAPAHAPPTPVAAPIHAAAPARVAERAPPSVQRLGISDALDYFADKANLIPGFRMLTIILGVNPINMSTVDRSAANVLRAMIEFLPGGALITQALTNAGVFDKVGAWVSDQIATLNMTGAALKQAVMTFLDSLSWSDIFHLGDVWDRAKRIFTEPIDRLIAFGKGLVDGILKMIKDAILLPLAKLAEGTRGWNLLIAVLGKNPITGDAVPRTAETLVGGFLKLINQDEIWANMQKANAIPRAWAWFQSTMSALLAFVSAIPDKFIAAFKSLTIEDVVLVVGAFQKIASVFGGFIENFISWAGNALWNLLEIIFDVVSPGALTYVKKTGAALKGILKDPMPFVHNLGAGIKLGFQNFITNFGTHLKEALIDWLTGSLPGVYIPKAVSLVEFGRFALSVLGITWAQIRAKIVKALGPNGETIMKGLETAFDIVVALVKGGPAAAWELIKEKLSDLKDTVVNGIVSFVTDTVIQKAVPKLISLFIPGAGFISAILSIYDMVKVFIEKLAKIVALVKSIVDAIVAIAGGEIAGAAKFVENGLTSLLSLTINFLAGFIGLTGIAEKVMAVVKKVQAAVDKALDAAIAWIIGKAKALFAKLFGKDQQPPDAKWAAGVAGINTDLKKMEAQGVTNDDLTKAIPGWKQTYGFTALTVVPNKDGWEIDGAMSPSRKIVTVPAEGTEEDPFGLDWPKPATEGYPTLYLGGLTDKTTSQKDLKELANAGKPDATGTPVSTYTPAAGGDLKGGKIGIPGAMSVDKKIGPLSNAATPGGDKLRNILVKYGYSPAAENKDMDHVQEIQFGGLDALSNLWPLDASMNRSAGSRLSKASAVFRSGKTVPLAQLKQDTTKKYWFKILSTAPPP